MTIAEPVKIARKITGIFEKLQIPHYVVGSLASSFHGIPRATADADFIADIKPKHIRQLSTMLEKEFYVDEEQIQKAVDNFTSFNAIHLKTLFKIDVFIQKRDPLSKAEMARREKYQVTEEKGQELYIASAEDTVLSKLQWYRSGGCVSDRQWNDVLGIIQVCSSDLDYDYMENTAEKVKLTGLLKKAMKAAGVIKSRL